MHGARGWGYGLGTVTAVFLAAWFTWSVPLSGQSKYVSVPKAKCGPGERPENGLQGQMTLAERFSTPQAYNCNLEPVGQFAGEGGSWHMAEFENCAYYSQIPNPNLEHRGTVVVDASDPRQPKAATYLDSSQAVLASNESLEVHKARKLLIAADWFGPAGTFEVWDVSDCRGPVRKGSLDLRDMSAHGGNLPTDGLTYYAGYLSAGGPRASNAAVVAIDVSDPSKPRELARWNRPADDWNTHAAGVSDDGNRVYLATIGSPARLTILDSSEIQARKPNAQFRLITNWDMEGTSGGQFAIPAKIKGRPYLIYSAVRPRMPRGAACAGFGVPWIIDISDEKNPKTTSMVTLEVGDPANCSKVANDPTYASTGAGYSNTYCSTDNNQDAKLLACGFGEGGLRVFDIRDAARPREIAYYKPPAWRTQNRLASYYGIFGNGIPLSPAQEAVRKASTYRPPTNDHTADAVMMPVFKKNGTEIWFVSADGGFQIVRFTDRFKAAEKNLFGV